MEKCVVPYTFSRRGSVNMIHDSVCNRLFQVSNVNKAVGSVSKMVQNGNRVVFDTSGSYIENKVTKDVLWLREKDGVYVVDVMVAPPGR